MAALLETDWTKMRARLHAAEPEIRERQRVLSEDHGGTAKERQAIVDAINMYELVAQRSDRVEESAGLRTLSTLGGPKN